LNIFFTVSNSLEKNPHNVEKLKITS